MKKIYLLLLVVLCVSCNEKVYSDIENIPVEECYIDNEIKVLLTKEEYSVDKIVELKTNDTLVDIFSCDKFIIENECCYVLDQKSRKIFVFDEHGNLKHSLGKIGHAADELTMLPTDFVVDKETKDLYMFESFSRKIIQYDSLGVYNSVSFLENIYPSMYFALNKKGNFVFSFSSALDEENGTPEVAVFDRNFEMLNGYLPFFESQTYGTPFPFGMYYDFVAYIPQLGENVYIFDADTISSCIHFSFKSPYMPKKQRDEVLYGSKFENFAEFENYIHRLSNYSENEYWKLLKYFYSSIEYHCIIDKRTGKVYNGSILFKGFLPYDQIAISGDKLVFFVTKERLDFTLDDVEYLLSDQWKARCDATHPAIRKLIDGELKAPCLIYVSFP